MTRPIFNRCMKLIAATWPDRNATAETAAAYWLALQELDDSVFEAAIAECIKACTFYPKPAEIREKAQAVLNNAGLLPQPGVQAWAGVLAALKLYHPDLAWMEECGFGSRLWTGGGGNPLPALSQQAVRAIGGLDRIFNASDRDLGFIRQEFLAFYDHKREQDIRYGPQLMGQALPAAVSPVPLPEPERGAAA